MVKSRRSKSSQKRNDIGEMNFVNSPGKSSHINLIDVESSRENLTRGKTSRDCCNFQGTNYEMNCGKFIPEQPNALCDPLELSGRGQSVETI